MQVQIQKTEIGLVIPISDELAHSFGFGFGDTVEIRRENGHLVVISSDEPQFNIEEMIATITPENRHAEISTGPPRGNEVW